MKNSVIDKVYKYQTLFKTSSSRYSDRAFFYDAFVSHRNGNNLSEKLAEVLIENGLIVWHDIIVSIPNFDIKGDISKALRNSRFIVVCLDKRRVSKWMKAEYKLALEFEKKYNKTKVLVVQCEEYSVIPNELKLCKVFGIYQSDYRIRELINLLKYQTEENLIFSHQREFERLHNYENLQDNLLSSGELFRLNKKRLSFLISRIEVNETDQYWYNKLPEDKNDNSYMFEIFFRQFREKGNMNLGFSTSILEVAVNENKPLSLIQQREIKEYYSYIKLIISIENKSKSVGLLALMNYWLWDGIFAPFVFFAATKLFTFNSLEKNFCKLCKLAVKSLDSKGPVYYRLGEKYTLIKYIKAFKQLLNGESYKEVSRERQMHPVKYSSLRYMVETYDGLSVAIEKRVNTEINGYLQ